MNEKNTKNILVTGGAGFIGYHLSKKLLELNYNIIVIDNLNKYYDQKLKKDRLNILKEYNNFKFYKTDMTDFKELEKIIKKNKIDLIYHLAAQAGVRYSFENPEVYLTTNIEGTYNILKLMVKYKIYNLIFSSTSSIYGNSDKKFLTETDDTNHPVSLYASTKKACEGLIHYYHHQYNIKSIILRYFTVYGPYGRPDMALFKFTKNILEDKPIDVYNQGQHQRGFTYINDIVEGSFKALELFKQDRLFEIINLGNNQTNELEYFIELIEKELNKKAEKNYLPLQPGDVIKTAAGISKAKELLNWQPFTSLEQGISNFTKWYKEYYL